MLDRIADELRAEIAASAPDVWERVRASVGARRLLAALDRPPAPHSRRGWELRLRINTWKEAA